MGKLLGIVAIVLLVGLMIAVGISGCGNDAKVSISTTTTISGRIVGLRLITIDGKEYTNVRIGGYYDRSSSEITMNSVSQLMLGEKYRITVVTGNGSRETSAELLDPWYEK